MIFPGPEMTETAYGRASPVRTTFFSGRPCSTGRVVGFPGSRGRPDHPRSWCPPTQESLPGVVRAGFSRGPSACAPQEPPCRPFEGARTACAPCRPSACRTTCTAGERPSPARRRRDRLPSRRRGPTGEAGHQVRDCAHADPSLLSVGGPCPAAPGPCAPTRLRLSRRVPFRAQVPLTVRLGVTVSTRRPADSPEAIAAFMPPALVHAPARSRLLTGVSWGSAPGPEYSGVFG